MCGLLPPATPPVRPRSRGEYSRGSLIHETVTDLLIAEVADGRGEIIDKECEVGGYSVLVEATRKPFNPAGRDLTQLANRSRGVGTLSKDPLSE